MSNGAVAGGAAGGAAAAAAAIAQAIRASGAIIKIEPSEFEKILIKKEKPLVVYSKGGFLTENHQYLISYKGFIFFTKSKSIIRLPASIEVIEAKKIWIP